MRDKFKNCGCDLYEWRFECFNSMSSHVNEKRKTNPANFNLQLKNPKRSFVRPSQTKIQENFENLRLSLVGGVVVSTFCSYKVEC